MSNGITSLRFARALAWIDQNSVPGAGICVNSENRRPYPEVSGYYIPTLLAWNEPARAISFGEWLISCQHAQGSWGDANENAPYAFDTGQIVKGLLALAKLTGEQRWTESIRRASEWMCGLVDDEGRPDVPDVAGWGGAIPLGILLYAYQAVREAGEYLAEPRWVATVDRLIAWFLRQPGLTDFTHLSHFHAYILESLCDLGLHDHARRGMEKVAQLQRADGAVPGFSNVRWICSTGLFQYAIVWYKLGERERADRAFAYAAGLQNRSGGWYGSYGWFAKYFPKAEISWAVKYFLDALQLRLKASFEAQSSIFSETVDREDGRYRLIREELTKAGAQRVLDAGCGKGRYLRNLVDDAPHLHLHACDLSDAVMQAVPEGIERRQGSLLSLPYPSGSFDAVYTIEALEHAVHIEGALRELLRVLKPGGILIIVDKDAKRLGSMALPDWEQWFEPKDLASRLEALGCSVELRTNIPYEGQADGLFAAWIATKAAT